MSPSATEDSIGPEERRSVLVAGGEVLATPEKAGAALAVATVEEVDARQEIDVWWGSFCGRTMLPSFGFCLLLTCVIAYYGFTETRQRAQLFILGISGALWLVQLVRWSHRFYSFNYRLTNRRLFVDRGFFYMDRFQTALCDIGEIRPRQNRFERLVGIGSIFMRLQNQSRRTVALAGVRDPYAVAELIAKTKKAALQDLSTATDR